MAFKTKGKRKKYSLVERIHYNFKKRSETKDNIKYAELTGKLDALSGERFDASMFKSDVEKNAYFKGVEKGYKVYSKAREVKF